MDVRESLPSETVQWHIQYIHISMGHTLLEISPILGIEENLLQFLQPRILGIHREKGPGMVLPNTGKVSKLS